MKSILYLIPILVFIFISCEDPYDIDIEAGESQLVVDAFVNNNARVKSIKLSKSVDFFDATYPPPAVSNAQVAIVNISDGNIFQFVENTLQVGEYRYIENMSTDFRFGKVGDTLNLFIAYQEDTFTSFSVIKRTTAIDSIEFIFEEESTFNDEGFVAELKASDSVGPGDIYWIRTWINGTYLSKASEINLAYDASFTPGANSDGIPFIFPIRRGINPVLDEEIIEGENAVYNPETPYEFGDSIYVEIWSINESTLFFLQQIQSEVNNGGLFATPPTNVRTNVFNINPNKETAAIGHFCISEVSSAYNVLRP